MKKIYIMAVLALLAATPAIANSVVGSKHDMIFSGFATGPGGSTEVCVFCHTPHGAQTSVTQAPLWNNTPSASIGVANIYSSGTMNYAVTAAQINATDARLCLSCHDGGVGLPVNQPNSGAMVISANLMATNTLLGTNLSNDHPIGMDLGNTPEVTDPGIRTIAYIIGPSGFNKNPFRGTNNTMWCTSCHDVHDNAIVPFLRKNNAGSALCKTCHRK